MSRPKKLISLLKTALQSNGDLPVEWECGGDQTIVWFTGWGAEVDRNSKIESAMTLVRETIIDKLSLPNASETLNEGGGSVGFRAQENAIVLSYSMTHVAYDYHDDKLPAELLDMKQSSVEVKDIAGFDCSVSIEYSYEESDPNNSKANSDGSDWSKKVYFHPKPYDYQQDQITESLREPVARIIEIGRRYYSANAEPVLGVCQIKGFYIDGKFDSSSNQIVYDVVFKYEYGLEVERNSTVVLFQC